MKKLLTNAQIILNGENTPQPGNILIDDDIISDVGDVKDSKDLQNIDCKGAILAPGIIDLGVFAIDKPAFRFGGITRAALLPDQSPTLDLPAMIKHSAAEGKPDFWSHPVAAATKRLEGKELAEIGLMKQAGALAVSTGRQWISDSGIML